MWLVSIWPVGGNLPFELLPGRYNLGRSRSCDIRVCDLSISRQHASLVVDDGQNAKLQDLGSRNGIEMNGRITKSLRLHLGDDFRVGAVRLSVLMKPSMNSDSPNHGEGSTIVCGKPESQRTVRVDSAVLTPAQSQVLDLAVKGLSEKEIAEQLQCRYHTIHTHFKAIYKALGVHSRAEMHAKLPILRRRKKR